MVGKTSLWAPEESWTIQREGEEGKLVAEQSADYFPPAINRPALR